MDENKKYVLNQELAFKLDFFKQWFTNIKNHVFRVKAESPEVEKKLNELTSAIKSLPGMPVSVLNSPKFETKTLEQKLDLVVSALNNLPRNDNSELTNAIDKLKSALMGTKEVKVTNQKDVKFPKEMKVSGKVDVDFPKEQKVTGSVSVSEFDELVAGLQVVVDAINDLKLETSHGFENQIQYMGQTGSRANMKIVDSDGDELAINADGSITTSGGGGGTQYDEDDAHTTGDTGTMMLGVRNDTLASLVDADGDYTPLQVDQDGALYTIEKNLIDTNNTTTSVLAGDAVYTGTGTDVSQYSTVTIQIDSSHDSATNGMTFQFSTDNSNWDDVYSWTYTAADGARRFQFPVTAQYFRVVYTNGSTLQTHFRVQTILHSNNTLTSIHRLGDDVKTDRSAQLMKTAIIAQKAGAGDFIPIQSTSGGNLKMSVQEISDGLDIGAGNAGTETQRVSISSDDVNLSAIKTAAELIDNAIYTENDSDASITGIPIMGEGGSNFLYPFAVVSAGDSGSKRGMPIYGSSTASGWQPFSLGPNGEVEMIGDVEHDAADNTGSADDTAPVKIGGRAATSEPSAVANGDRVRAYFDANGYQYVKLGAGTAAIGKLAANSGVDIGDVDVTSLPALAAGTNVIGIVDNIPTDYELNGNTTHVKKYYTSAGAATDGIVWSPAAGKRWYITDIIINVSAAATVTLEDDLTAGDSPVFKAELAANSGISHSFNTPLYSGEDAADLLVTTDAGNVYITVTGYEV